MQLLYNEIREGVDDLMKLADPEIGARVNADALKRRAVSILSLELIRTIEETLRS